MDTIKYCNTITVTAKGQLRGQLDKKWWYKVHFIYQSPQVAYELNTDMLLLWKSSFLSKTNQYPVKQLGNKVCSWGHNSKRYTIPTTALLYPQLGAAYRFALINML